MGAEAEVNQARAATPQRVATLTLESAGDAAMVRARALSVLDRPVAAIPALGRRACRRRAGIGMARRVQAQADRLKKSLSESLTRSTLSKG